MKTTGFLCLFWVGLVSPVKAQITITNAVFPAVGDTLYYAIDNQPDGIVITPPGGGQQWDLANLHPRFIWQQIFQDAQAGADHESFPAATLFYQTANPNVEAYLNVSAQEVTLLGFSGPDSTVLGIDLAFNYNPPIVQSRAPVQFFDIRQASSGLLLPFAPGLLPGSNQLPVTSDSLRIRMAISRLDVVDAWGTLSIPGGAYEVLREKRTEYRETRLDAKVPPLGWLDITDVAIQYLQLSTLGVDTTTNYFFLNGQSKEVIAICTTDNSGLRVVSVQYKDLNISTGIKKAEQAAAGLTIFPNPAGDILYIRPDGLKGEGYTAFIFTILGQEVLRKTSTGALGKPEELLDIANLEKGIYVCKISNGSGQMGQALFLKQ